MANIRVRNLDDTTYEQLRLLAAKHGVSLEEEARQIIYQAVAAPERISQVFKKYFGQNNGIDLKILNQRKSHGNPIDIIRKLFE